ncbi:hypothetical protein [Microbacterium sp. P03]|uniref:hypothetical protein n=1 Tax=Microbacterium sp. P03 TaxID=3366946 RepID=UPI0037463851
MAHLTEPVPSPHERPVFARVEGQAVYAAYSAGVLGAVVGLIIGLTDASLPLSGNSSFGTLIALFAAAAAAVVSATGYWRSRTAPGQEWRLALSPVRFGVNAVSVVIVHTVLAVLATLVLFVVLGRAFIGLPVQPFWSTVLSAVVLGLVAYLVFLSVARMTTQRMSSLLMVFIVLGSLTAMVTTPDPRWWLVHFSHLGTFDDISSVVFNGTLIAGGLLVTTFAVYLANDMRALGDAFLHPRAVPVVSTMFVIMGVMLAGVGVFPVDDHLLLHNLSAMGLAVVYIGLLAAGPRVLRGMPRAYFLASWGFLASVIVSLVLFIVGYFGLTAFEIIVFALIFGWIAVFIRFLGVTASGVGETKSPSPRSVQ